MNIRSIQTNLKKLQEDNILKFLYDIIINNLQNVNSYEAGVTYEKGDLIYIQEEGKHVVYQCMINIESSPENFLDSFDNWEHVLDVYEKENFRISNLKIKEEVHIITEETVNKIVSKLDYKSENSSFAIYRGKERYAINYDFTVNDHEITFNKPFNVGDKLILEVRESIGLPDRLVLLSTNGLRYEIGVVGEDVYILESDHRTAKNEVYIKDISNGNNYKIHMIDCDVYYELTDINVSKTEVKMMDVDGVEYRLEMIDDELVYSIKE